MATLKYWLWLTGRTGASPMRLGQLLERFGTPERVYFADAGEYALQEALSPALRQSLEDKSLDGAEKQLEQCEELGISLLTIQDAHYPDCLKNIPDPPVVLYYKGKLPDFDRELTVGVVGARACTPYGQTMAARLGLELTRAGAVLISGIAQGVDSHAIRGALAGGGTVVSVLGCGIDVRYPRESRFLYDDVAAAGALISEYPPGTPAVGGHFPVRNRILSGLSDGVVAVEARERSGTLVTMNLALEQNRDTFAVPGPADAPMSAGTNRLIQEGCAKLVTCAADILTEYQGRRPLRRPSPMDPQEQKQRLEAAVSSAPEKEEGEKKEVDKRKNRAYIDWKSARELFTDDERDILLALGEREKLADEIIEATQIPARRVLSALTVLQVRGYVEERRGKRFAATALLREAETD
jgi:DNA processing protein